MVPAGKILAIMVLVLTECSTTKTENCYSTVRHGQ